MAVSNSLIVKTYEATVLTESYWCHKFLMTKSCELLIK